MFLILVIKSIINFIGILKHINSFLNYHSTNEKTVLL